MSKLRIMSNNVWWRDKNSPQWEEIGADCSSAHRAPLLFEMYRETAPDLIGLQECSAPMTQMLMTAFAENNAPYSLLWGKDTPIIFRTDKFELVDSETVIYPEQIPGLEGCFNNLKTKSYCIAVLRLKETGSIIVFATTHLWYRSGNPELSTYYPFSHEARAWQLSLVADRVNAFQKKYGGCAVIAGDFNTYESSLAIRAVRERGFVHAHDVATEHVDESTGMHFCCDKGFDTAVSEGGFARSIDHILVRGDCTVRNYQRYYAESYMPLSDHLPLWIDVEL